MNKKTLIMILLIVGIPLLVKTSFLGLVFVLPEGRQAVITEFGKPVGKPIVKAGLHFKKPFVHEVRYVDKRILYWDGKPNQIPTKEKKYIKVDTTARWIIVDALKFIQTVRSEHGAKQRLNAVLDAATRNVISSHNLVEAVRNSNAIIGKIEEKKAEMKLKKDRGENIIDEEITVEVRVIKVGREELSKLIVEGADKGLALFGIKLIDVQLRRISYEKTVENKVYERMISERQKIAQKIRSIGKGEKAKIEGRLTKDLKTIESFAYRSAQKVRGDGEAKSIAIYAKSLTKDPDFYEFMRSMDAYKKTLKGKMKFLLSSDSEFLRFLNKDK